MLKYPFGVLHLYGGNGRGIGRISETTRDHFAAQCTTQCLSLISLSDAIVGLRRAVRYVLASRLAREGLGVRWCRKEQAGMLCMYEPAFTMLRMRTLPCSISFNGQHLNPLP